MTEDRAFLKAILEHPDDDARKLVYADWLEDQGDPRSEYLRLMVKVRQERIITPKQRQRHNELSTELAKLRAQERQEWEAAVGDRGPPRENRKRQRRVNELKRQLADLSRTIRQQIPARLQELAATLNPRWLAVVSDPDIKGWLPGRRSGRSSRHPARGKIS